MNTLGFVLFLSLSIAASGSCYAQNILTSAEKDTVIAGIKAGIESEYVFIQAVEELNRTIDELDRSGKYDEINDYPIFAQTLTSDLVAATNDKHFAVGYNPDFVAAMRKRRETAAVTKEDQASPENEQLAENTVDWNRWYGLQDNLGFKKVEVLDGNIGYMQITFFQPLDWTRSIIDSTMGFVANTDALILDLRKNGGGYSPADSYLGSFFFDDKPVLWMSGYSRSEDEPELTFTSSTVGGPRYLDKPVYILVSDQSFSLAEQFSYSMKHHGKATLIGATTSGASHSINVVDVSDNFILQVPNSYSRHPVTKSNWEGVGVMPDIETIEEKAFNQAYLEALDALESSATHERQRERYRQVREQLQQP